MYTQYYFINQSWFCEKKSINPKPVNSLETSMLFWHLNGWYLSDAPAQVTVILFHCSGIRISSQPVYHETSDCTAVVHFQKLLVKHNVIEVKCLFKQYVTFLFLLNLLLEWIELKKTADIFYRGQSFCKVDFSESKTCQYVSNSWSLIQSLCANSLA